MADVVGAFQTIARSYPENPEPCVRFVLKLERPFQLSYTVKSLACGKKSIHPKRFRRSTGGPPHAGASNFAIEVMGRVEGPEELRGAPCSVNINPSNESDYVETFDRGIIGDGWYDHTAFHFRLYLSPQMTRDFIEQPRLRDSISGGISEDEDWVWMKIHLDVVQYTPRIKVVQRPILYNILRLRCC